MSDKSVIIIGAGIAGLSAGCYAQMNGYRAQIFELHSQPGGLCTAWQRKGYTIDGCIHWLVGSTPTGGFYRLWQEVGLIQGREFLYLDEMTQVVARNGQTFTFYTDLDRLEHHMLELSPDDRPVIEDFIGAARSLVHFDPPVDVPPMEIMNPIEKAKAMAGMLRYLPVLQKWSGVSVGEFAARFESPLLREAFEEIWHPEFGILFLLMTLVWMNNRAAGYPIGGSLPLARAVEERFLALGGQIHYNARVDKILVDEKAGKAAGVRLADGREERADVVISAADGHATIFEMLEGRYIDDVIRGYYRDLIPFPSLVHVALGVNRTFEGETRMIGGRSIPIDPPLEVGKTVDRIGVNIYNFDPTLAPAGKTVITVLFHGDYEYWQALAADRKQYEARKQEIAEAIIRTLDGQFPGLAGQVEMIDVATPLTFARYTGNWRGSYEGWMPTPKVGFEGLKNTLPGLDGFYMIGQWVAPGGGLPSGVKTGRDVVQILCKRDGAKFVTTLG
jgi:phytoene dehydrogenase-like protein